MDRGQANHYEQLGVDRDATPGQIKRAYRSRARKAHPDKGGSAAKFAPIAKAYEVLMDPERRMLYDVTGADAKRPIEMEIQNTLLQGFNQALAQPDCEEIVEAVREALEREADSIPDEVERLTTRKDKLTARREKISATSVNLVHMVIDGEVKNIDAALIGLEHKAQVMAGCLEALDAYTEEPEIVEKHRGVWIYNVNGVTYG